MIKKILIVCVGNICRSPIGAALFKSESTNFSSEIQVSSAGIAALVDKPADLYAQELMRQMNLDISDHRARQLTPELLFESDIIFTMTTGQVNEIESKLPSIRGRVHRLGKWGDFDVPDPYRRPKEAFNQALDLLKQGVKDWCHRLWN